MGHNVVILSKDTDPSDFVRAAQPHASEGYISPGQGDTITFTAPQEPGDRTFLCSFPGHYQIGMKGTMRVQDPQ